MSTATINQQQEQKPDETASSAAARLHNVLPLSLDGLAKQQKRGLACGVGKLVYYAGRMYRWHHAAQLWQPLLTADEILALPESFQGFTQEEKQRLATSMQQCIDAGRQRIGKNDNGCSGK